MDRKKEIQGHLFSLFTIFIWGTTFISTKILLKAFTPIEILFIRFVIGYFALLALYPHRLKVKERKQELYFAGAGLCGITLYFLLENIALTYTLASNVGVIISIAPFFTAIFAHLLLAGEKMRAQFFIGFAVAVAGIFLISFNGSSQLKLNPMGDILAILAAAVWAIYSVLTKKISGYHYHTISVTRRIFFYGLLFMMPVLFIFKFEPDIGQIIKPVNLFNIIFLGFGASAICFVTWNYALKILGAVKTSVYIYMVPVITVITSVLILHETITGTAVLGILLTLAGLFISEIKLPARHQN
ncbi:MAG: DMT family transporter [Hungatella sp.]|nr:DMT family transporter [Hungatella sp.]